MAVPFAHDRGDASRLSPTFRPYRPDRCLPSRGPRRRLLSHEPPIASLARALACESPPISSHPEGERHVEA